MFFVLGEVRFTFKELGEECSSRDHQQFCARRFPILIHCIEISRILRRIFLPWLGLVTVFELRNV